MATAKRLPSGNWRVQVYAGKDANGKNIMESFTAATKKEAERDAAIFAMERKRKCKQAMTLGQAMDAFVQTCRVQGYSPSTIPDYISRRNQAYPSIINARIDQITENDVQSAIDARAKDHSVKTVRNDYYFLKKVLNKYCPSLRLDNITLAKRKKKRKLLMDENWAVKILDYSRSRFDIDFYLYCCFIISAGLRSSQVYALTWSDVSAEPIPVIGHDGNVYNIGTINIDKAKVRGEGAKYVLKDTKTESGIRQITVAWPFFENLYASKPRGADDEAILDLTPIKVGYRWRILRKDLGLPETMRFYDLRHYFATSVAYSGASEEQLAQVMGHSTSAFSHQVYVELFQGRQASVNEKMASKTADLFGSLSAGK